MKVSMLLQLALVVTIISVTLWQVDDVATADGQPDVASRVEALGAVPDGNIARQRGPTATPGGPIATPTQVPLVPPTATPTRVRPDRTPGAEFETNVNPNVRQPSGILTAPIVDAEEVKPEDPIGPVTGVQGDDGSTPSVANPRVLTTFVEPE